MTTSADFRPKKPLEDNPEGIYTYCYILHQSMCCIVVIHWWLLCILWGCINLAVSICLDNALRFFLDNNGQYEFNDEKLDDLGKKNVCVSVVLCRHTHTHREPRSEELVCRHSDTGWRAQTGHPDCGKYLKLILHSSLSLISLRLLCPQVVLFKCTNIRKASTSF